MMYLHIIYIYIYNNQYMSGGRAGRVCEGRPRPDIGSEVGPPARHLEKLQYA